jgi:hypothetical protein
MSIRDEEVPSFEIGDIIYECEAGTNIETRITSKPIEDAGHDGKRRWSWNAVNTQNGEEIAYMLTEGLSHYGPRLYRQPQYGRFTADGFDMPLYGAPQPAS